MQNHWHSIMRRNVRRLEREVEIEARRRDCCGAEGSASSADEGSGSDMTDVQSTSSSSSSGSDALSNRRGEKKSSSKRKRKRSLRIVVEDVPEEEGAEQMLDSLLTSSSSSAAAATATATTSAAAAATAAPAPFQIVKGAGTWTNEEDEIVYQMVVAHGVGNIKWSVIAAELPGRLGKQVRERWYNHLDPNVNKGPWTDAEDKLIMDMQA